MRHLHPRRDERGFTLIEILVVVVIIGILAGIAIPVFLNQKSKAYDAQVKAQAPDIAKSVETLYADTAAGTVTGTSDTSAVKITAAGLSQQVATTKDVRWSVAGSQAGYCIAVWSADGTKYTVDHPLLYDSTKGGVIPDGQSCATGNPTTLGVGAPVDPTSWVWVNVMASSVCAKTADGRVFCWGGIESAPYGTSNPILVNEPALSGVTAGAANHYLLADGSIQTKGGNYWGALGNGKASTYTSTTFEPVDETGVLAGKTITSLTNDCAATSDGTLACWGQNNMAGLGDGTYVNQYAPEAINSFGALAGQQVKTISGDARGHCALTTSGAVACWGWDPPGDGSSGPANTPRLVAGALTGKTVTQVISGGMGTSKCALTADQQVYCWGSFSNTMGEAVNGNLLVPTLRDMSAIGGAQITKLVFGANNTLCALTDDGSLWCYPSMGATAMTKVAGPVAGKKIVSASEENQLTCAVTDDGNLYCWGVQGYGVMPGVQVSTTPVLEPRAPTP